MVWSENERIEERKRVATPDMSRLCITIELCRSLLSAAVGVMPHLLLIDSQRDSTHCESSQLLIFLSNQKKDLVAKRVYPLC